jgi:hypothetical protein
MNNPSRQVRRQITRNNGLRIAGFTPSYSQRFANIVTRKLSEIVIEMGNQPHNPFLPTSFAEAQAEAQRRAVRDLPAPRMVRSHKIKPSKSDFAAYRKSGGPDLVFD